jgi:PadR family transcriptional regulator, regulatory protein PadR
MNMKGSLPLLILVVLSKGDSHGYQIAKAIKQQSSGVLDFKEGTLYPTLHNLEEQGVIEAFEQEESGRTRRYYRLTDEGRATLNRQRAEWERYSSAVETILRGAAT